MYTQTAHCREHLVTLRTLEFFHPHVSPNVSGKSTLDGKGAEALWTLEWLLVCVDTDVTHKVRWFLEFLGAVGTLVPSDAIDLQKRSRELLLMCIDLGGAQGHMVFLNSILT